MGESEEGADVLSVLVSLGQGDVDLPVDQSLVWEFFAESGVVSVCQAGPCSPGVVVDGLELDKGELGDVLVFVEAGPETSLKQVEGIRSELESRYIPASVISTGKVGDLQGEQCRVTVFTA